MKLRQLLSTLRRRWKFAVGVTDEDPQVARELARAEAGEIVKMVSALETPDKASEGDTLAPPIMARIAGDASFSANPVAPNLPLNLAIGALLGLLIGIAGAVLRDLLDTSIKTSDDLAAATGAAVMAVIPFDSSVPRHPSISDQLGSNERVEAFRVLRTNLQFVDLDAKRQMLVISSAVPDEGKTVTATNLAITLARTGRRVLILDCDLRKPRVAQILGLESSVGLLTVLVGSPPLGLQSRIRIRLRRVGRCRSRRARRIEGTPIGAIGAQAQPDVRAAPMTAVTSTERRRRPRGADAAWPASSATRRAGSSSSRPRMNP